MASVSKEAYLLHLLCEAERARGELNKKKTMLFELRTLEFWRAIIAECLATFMYVFLVCGSHVLWPLYSINTLTKSFANGLAMATAAQCFGHISGAHVNPAFTFAMLVTQKITPLRAFLYITAQCGGAIAGAALLYGVTSSRSAGDNLGCTVVHESVTSWQAMSLELVLTFIVAFTMCACADPNRKSLGSDALAVGLAYLVCCLIALPASGASMNPARSLGPAFVMNIWTNHWVYWCGPVIGGLLAGLIYEYIFDSSKKIVSSVRERDDSDKECSDAKDDTESKSSALLPSRPSHQSLHQPQQPQYPYYRPLTPHEMQAFRPHSSGGATAAKYVATGTVQHHPHPQEPVSTSSSYYSSSLPRGSSGYRKWSEYANSTGQFKF